METETAAVTQEPRHVLTPICSRLGNSHTSDVVRGIGGRTIVIDKAVRGINIDSAHTISPRGIWSVNDILVIESICIIWFYQFSLNTNKVIRI